MTLKSSTFHVPLILDVLSQLAWKLFHRLNELWVSDGEGAVPRERSGSPDLPCLLWDAVCPGGGEGGSPAG